MYFIADLAACEMYDSNPVFCLLSQCWCVCSLCFLDDLHDRFHSRLLM